MHIPLPQTPPSNSELLSCQDIVQQSPTLVHRTRASKAAYHNALINSEVEEGVEE
jgi:hypothetical protein